MITTTNKQKPLSRLRYSLSAFSLLTVIAFGVWGCSKDEITPETSGEPVLMNIDTRALSAGAADEQINTIRVLLVNRNNIGRTVDGNTFVSNPTIPLDIKVPTGNFDVYLVANETAGNSELPALQQVRTLYELKELTLPFSLDDRHFGNVPMFGQVEEVVITAQPGTLSPTNPANINVAGIDNGTTLSVPLIRMACKLDLKLKHSNGTLKEIRFENLPDAIPLFADHFYTPAAPRPVGTLAATEDTFDSEADPDDITYPLLDQPKQAILLPSWVFADPANSAEAIKLVAVLEDDANNETEFSTPIGHSPATETPDYTLLRNNAYTLTARVRNNTMSVVAVVESWKEEEVNMEDSNPVTPDP